MGSKYLLRSAEYFTKNNKPTSKCPTISVEFREKFEFIEADQRQNTF